jgi:predicted nucleic acid-binding protein
MIVADAAPVIAFARLGRLALLQHMVEERVVPDAVYDDLVVKGRGKPGAAEVAESTWIRRESIRHREATAHVPPVLGAGEREALVLAPEHHAVLLTDEQRARETAEKLGLAVVGVLWVLSEAKRRGFVPEVRSIVDALLAPGYRLHPDRVVRPFLEAMDEASPNATSDQL